ncbi:pilus assembly protein N-terminal domain-containing protein [Dongia rigui]|uniref:Pilus assembly protein N-terminal domain-containing protein n=1 Tax=Dongia rigui TaxID=940149 RepID=A0ABU5DTW6_9PROT|nr:pilus assembly protein N-terminal domain-containing protein [Dongia rigui]MDY0870764.1 pilus assembly protein N-terminal domain-containing protein [Dongia rigui]
MRMITKATIAAFVLASLAVPAFADDVVQVTWRKAQIMSFGEGVGGIIIGDPKVVDVTVEANGQIVVFGKTPGETNLIVTGADNTVLFNAPIVVMPEDNRQVSIINAGSGTISERSWTCLTRCVQVLGPGGTSYASIQPQGGGATAPAAAAGGSNAAATAAAQQTAQGVGNANAATAQGASGVVGQGGGIVITP